MHSDGRLLSLLPGGEGQDEGQTGFRFPLGCREDTKISPKTCCTHQLLCYIARPFPKVGRGTKTIYRQLFFVWLDNAFAFA
jgi:hypothetical protein